eukprot:6192783-Pleurochrysis_carterae.AAC.2
MIVLIEFPVFLPHACGSARVCNYSLAWASLRARVCLCQRVCVRAVSVREHALVAFVRACTSASVRASITGWGHPVAPCVQQTRTWGVLLPNVK